MPIALVSMSLLDGVGKRASFAYNVKYTTATLANLTAHVQTMIAEINSSSNSQILNAQILLDVALPGGIKTSPVAATRNSNGALVQMSTDGVYNDSFYIPNIVASAVVGDSIDLTGDVGDVIDLLVTGSAPDITGQPKSGSNFLAAISGKVSSRGSLT